MDLPFELRHTAMYARTNRGNISSVAMNAGSHTCQNMHRLAAPPRPKATKYTRPIKLSPTYAKVGDAPSGWMLSTPTVRPSSRAMHIVVPSTRRLVVDRISTSAASCTVPSFGSVANAEVEADWLPMDLSDAVDRSEVWDLDRRHKSIDCDLMKVVEVRCLSKFLVGLSGCFGASPAAGRRSMSCKNCAQTRSGSPRAASSPISQSTLQVSRNKTTGTSWSNMAHGWSHRLIGTLPTKHRLSARTPMLLKSQAATAKRSIPRGSRRDASTG
mmetsp:Transcript_41816/g.98003  ORF Transcript_41816/g.98003 Transcript_41816/m.98003 type:complete len:271 (+) Transcript_41816:488-1300(+)